MVWWLETQTGDQHPGSRTVLITLLPDTKEEGGVFFFLPERKIVISSP